MTLTVEKSTRSFGTVPESDLSALSKMIQSAAGKVWYDSTRSIFVFSRGIKLRKNFLERSTGKTCALWNAFETTRMEYVRPVVWETTLIVMLTSDPVKSVGVVPKMHGGMAVFSLTQSTSGLTVRGWIESPELWR